MTKAYLHFLTFIFVPLSLLAYWFSRKSKPFLYWPSIAMATMAVTALLSQSAWDHRNYSLFGENAAVTRKANAILGKVARLDSSDLFHHLDIALAASLGTNFCEHHYGQEQCLPFDYLGCDKTGLTLWKEYVSRYPTKNAAMSAVTHDMIRLYFQKPLVQITGTVLEFIRMIFFEAAETFGNLPAFVNKLIPVWHIGGSLLFLGFAFLGIRRFFGNSSKMQARETDKWALYGFSLLIIAFHFAFMSEFTNVSRYIYPILPFIYVWVAEGIAWIF